MVKMKGVGDEGGTRFLGVFMHLITHVAYIYFTSALGQAQDVY